MNSILIIEDDFDIAKLICHNLNDIQCNCKIEHSGLDGQLEALSNSYDLIILDINLPEKNGIDICKELRASKNFTPILMLTARSEEIDRVLGLESGADDYLTKPFNPEELDELVKKNLFPIHYALEW